MGERHERSFLLAFQKIFIHHPRIALGLIDAFGSGRAAFEAGEWELMPHFGPHEELFRAFRHFDGWAQIDASLALIESLGGRVISCRDESYPELLRCIFDAPPVITAIGPGIDAFEVPSVAIVGSRKATRHGREIAAAMAEGLAQEGFAVVSGMAFGIDAAAHRGALIGGGRTIAVFGSGPDINHPPSNRELAREIGREGLIVSEFPPGEPPYASNFPQRNRIISGLALATVVVEAEARSGSLITARLALEQGREVMAVPGPALAPLSRGTNRLIHDGALLVEDPADVSEALEPLIKTMGFSKRAGHLKNVVDKDSRLFRALRARGGRCFDELALETGLDVKALSTELIDLKLAGLVDELPGRRWRLSERDG